MYQCITFIQVYVSLSPHPFNYRKSAALFRGSTVTGVIQSSQDRCAELLKCPPCKACGQPVPLAWLLAVGDDILPSYRGCLNERYPNPETSSKCT